MADLLADACRSAGYATAWLHPRRPCRVQGAAAAIFDGDALDAATVNALKRLARHVSPAPILVLLGAPRIQDVRAVQSLGGTVLAKPFRVDELLWVIRTAIAIGDKPVERTADRIITQSRKGATRQAIS
jgi:DNA-binding response OmpR family regulator